MSSLRHTRKLAAVLTLIGLLFAQMVVSAYACPAMAPDQVVASVDDSMPPCHKSADADRGLCLAHCQDGQKISGDHTALHSAATFVAAFTITLLPASAEALPAAPISADLFRATSPPASIRNCCFRI